MTLPVFGTPISIDDLRTEFSVSGQRSLQDFYAGAGIVSAGTVGFPNGGSAVVIPSSGEISLNNFYGASAAFQFTLSANEQDVDLRARLIAAGWDQSVSVIVTVNEGVWITSSQFTGALPMTITGPFPNGIRINLNGIIAGGGGNGFSRTPTTSVFPTSGETAIVITNAAVVIALGNNGAILGGGGGGAGWFTGGGGGAGGGDGGDSSWNYTGFQASGAVGPSGLSAPIKGTDGSQNVQSAQDVIGGGGSGGWTFAPNANGRAYGGGKPGFDDGTGNPQNTSRGGQGGWAGAGAGGWISSAYPILDGNGNNIGVRGGNGGTSYRFTSGGSPNIFTEEGQQGLGESAALNVAGGGGGGGAWGRKGGDSSYQESVFVTRIRAGAVPGRAISLYSGATVTLSGAVNNYAGSITTFS